MVRIQKQVFTNELISMLSRRLFLFTLGSCYISAQALASVQKEETLSDDVASVMSRAIRNANPPHLIFPTPQAGQQWLNTMSQRLTRFVPDEYARKRLLINLQYEATRAGLDAQLILSLIEIESAFRQYAISSTGARGLMQVMPFWKKHIGLPEHNLFDIRTNLRYGCTILRYYLQIEHGNIRRALARYNGSLGKNNYPNAIFRAWKNHWEYH